MNAEDMTVLVLATTYAKEWGYRVRLSPAVRPGAVLVDPKQRTIAVHLQAGTYAVSRNTDRAFDSTVKA